MRIVQIIHDGERGGVQTLARMIEQGLAPQRFRIETEYLYPRPGISVFAKLGYVLRMARLIWRGDFDALIAYQSTASILVGVVGLLRRLPLSRRSPNLHAGRNAAAAAVYGYGRRHARSLLRQYC